MGRNSKISWTDDTSNPVVVKDGGWYCIKVSEGCANCYAESLNRAGRFGGNGLAYRHLSEMPELDLRRDLLDGWSRRTKPRKIFVASMTDIAGEFVPDEWIFEILDAMQAAPRQTFLVLTKRTRRMARMAVAWQRDRNVKRLPDNIWWGFSAENQARFDERWEDMRAFAWRGHTTWVSAEPLIGPIALPDEFLAFGSRVWCVAGGESGPEARPMHPRWAQNLRDQCVPAGVPYHFKQWGAWAPVLQGELNDYGQWTGNGPEPHIEAVWETTECGYYCDEAVGHVDHGQWYMKRVGKKAAGRLLDGREWDEMPAPQIIER